MGHVESPQDRPVDLGAPLVPHLVEVGMLPDVLNGPGEAPFAVEQRRGVRDRSPAIELVFRVQREVDADVLAAIGVDGAPRPGGRDH